jgi:hypothetical protein
MEQPVPVHMPLSSAYLCQDCNCVGNNARSCPLCASEALLSLASVLDRTNDNQPEFESEAA